MGKIIGVVSLKGGVGKTSVTAALGDALAGFGKKVLLVDGNLSAPNLGLHFNIVNPEFSLHHILDRTAKLDDAIHNVYGTLDVIPASLFDKLKTSTPLKLKDRISFLKEKYDVIIIDSSPALDDETLGVILASDEVLVVSTPDYPTLSNTLKAVRLAKQRGVPISGIILNKVYKEDFELTLKDIEDVVEVPVMAVIPHDVRVLKALSEFVPQTKYSPNSKGSDEIKRLASVLIGEKYNPSGFRRLFMWMNPEKQEINRTIFYDEVFGN